MPPCPACGSEVGDWRFCQRCGAPLPYRYPYQPTSPYPGRGPAARPATVRRVESRSALVLGASGALLSAAVAASAFLPWVRTPTLARYTVTGFQRNDGKVLFVVAALAALLFIAGAATARAWPFALALAACVVSASVLLAEAVNVVTDRALSFSSLGWGLLLGSAAAVAGIFVAAWAVASGFRQ